MASFGVRFEPAVREKLRRRLIQRRAALMTLLAGIAIARDRSAALAALGQGCRPNAVSDALDQVERRRILLIAGDDRYGRCEVCGADLALATLEEAAWADHCVAHRASRDIA